MLPMRDLSPFGFLRLDMRPAHAVLAEPGSWALETEFATQNTWAMSPEVEELPDRTRVERPAPSRRNRAGGDS